MANPNYVIECYNHLTNQNFSMQDFREGKLKGLYIPEERKVLEEECGVDDVELVFGEPTRLEKVEAIFLEIEQDRQLTKEIKYEYLIKISYEISNACGFELDSNNPVWDKYAILFTEIPIGVYRCEKRPLWYPGLKMEKQTVTVDELKTAKIWLTALEEAKTNLEKKVYLEYIFELVFISLKEIFKEVKAEIMDQ